MNCQIQTLKQQCFRKPGWRVVFKNMINLFYSVVDQKVKNNEFGCGFYVSVEFLKYVKDFKIINERKCCLRLKAEQFSCTLINVHAPTNEKMEEIKEEFYKLLEQNINQISRSHIKIILGDITAKVGKENIYKPTIGNDNLHNETNNNGIKGFSLRYL